MHSWVPHELEGQRHTNVRWPCVQGRILGGLTHASHESCSSFMSIPITSPGEKVPSARPQSSFLEQEAVCGALTVRPWTSRTGMGLRGRALATRGQKEDENVLSPRIKGISFLLPLLLYFHETGLQRGLSGPPSTAVWTAAPCGSGGRHLCPGHAQSQSWEGASQQNVPLGGSPLFPHLPLSPEASDPESPSLTY